MTMPFWVHMEFQKDSLTITLSSVWSLSCTTAKVNVHDTAHIILPAIQQGRATYPQRISAQLHLGMQAYTQRRMGRYRREIHWQITLASATIRSLPRMSILLGFTVQTFISTCSIQLATERRLRV